MPGYLIDTNHLSAALDRVSPLRERLHQAHRQGIRLGTCVPVLCELEVGIQQGSRLEVSRRALDRLLREVRLWPVDRPIDRLFGEFYLLLKQRGRALSHVDIVLAAMARHRNVTLLTADRDFEALPEIHTENWLT
jgi:predicted nucleic acid-binding protein